MLNVIIKLPFFYVASSKKSQLDLNLDGIFCDAVSACLCGLPTNVTHNRINIIFISISLMAALPYKNTRKTDAWVHMST